MSQNWTFSSADLHTIFFIFSFTTDIYGLFDGSLEKSATWSYKTRGERGVSRAVFKLYKKTSIYYMVVDSLNKNANCHLYHQIAIIYMHICIYIQRHMNIRAGVDKIFHPSSDKGKWCMIIISPWGKIFFYYYSISLIEFLWFFKEYNKLYQ